LVNQELLIEMLIAICLLRQDAGPAAATFHQRAGIAKLKESTVWGSPVAHIRPPSSSMTVGRL
jgi:hypothetical protein